MLAAEADLLAQLGKPGELVAGVPPGHENDILANTSNPNATLLQSDVDALIARAGVHLSALPGDLVANKDGSEQNLGVGAPLDLFAPRGGTAHADGLYAYCIDLHRHIPQRGKGYDVLGPASGLGASQMTALQKVIEEIGRRQASSGLAPDGAQDAVWAVTDGVQPNPEAKAILDAAGVAFDQQSFSQTPHYNDPNAGGADTAAVTPGGVVTPVQADRSPPPGEPLGGEDPFATATGRLLAARVVTGRSRRKVGLRLAVDASQETVVVGLQRRGRGRVVPVTVLGVQGGIAEATLKFRRGLPKGRHRLVLQGTAGWTRKLPFTIGAKPKKGHKARR